MSIRNKTKRRLTILLASFLALCGLTTAIVVYQLNKRQAEALAARDTAIAAAQDARYADAVEQFRTAMKYYHADPEALYWLARARREIPMPNAKHLEEAIAYLDRALKFRPDYPQAQQDLLQLYVGIRRDTEAMDLAEKVLANDPHNFEATRARIIALTRFKKLGEALAAADQAIAARPDEYRLYMLRLDTMRQQEAAPADIIAFGNVAARGREGDPRFRLVMAFAHWVAEDPEKAREYATPLAAAVAPDSEYLDTLVTLLDGLDQFELSLKALETSAPHVQSPRASQALLRRLWEAGQQDRILDRLADLDPAAARTPGESIALKAMALIQSGTPQDAQPLFEALEKRTHDPRAQAWAIVVGESLGHSPRTTAELLSELRTALAKDPTNPFVLYAQGDAYARMGENEAALSYWQQITGTDQFSGYAPSWSLPFVRIAQAYGQMGRHEEALEAAHRAWQRAPRSSTAVMALITARYQALQAGLGGDRDRQQMLAQLADVQTKAPNEPLTLPMYVDLLAQSGKRDQALQVLSRALDDQALTLDEPAWVRLAGVSARHALGLDDRAFERSEKQNGLTATLALSRALHLLGAKDAAAARQYMAQVLSRIGPEKSDVSWRLAWARLLDASGDAMAHDLWAALIDEFPDDLAVQRSALESRSLRADRPLSERAIQRIKAISGESGLAWRLAEARLLAAPGSADADLLSAANLLKQIIRESPNLVEPRLMLAETQRRLGIAGEAIDQLNQVSVLQPGSADVLLQLAQLYLDQGDFENTRAQLRRVSTLNLNPAQTVAAARLGLGVGGYEQVVRQLEPIHLKEPTDARAGMPLVQAYVRLGEIKKAESVLEKLVEQPTTAVIAAYADLLSATGRPERADEVLKRLDELKLPASEREMIIFAVERRQIDKLGPEKVASRLLSAIEADPKNAAAYHTLIAFYVETGQVDKALQINEKAFNLFPEDRVFELPHRESELIRFAAADPLAHPLVAALMSGGSEAQTSLEAARLVREARQPRADVPGATRKLAQLAARNPRSLPVQLLLVDWYLERRQLEAAGETAMRAMHAFPTEPAAAERAVRAQTELRHWEQVISAAEEWRRRAPSMTRAADLATAQSLINMGQPDRALECLDPYRDTALKDPAHSPTVLTLYCTALISSGRVADAANVLKPLLAQPQWRSLWMNLAASAIRDARQATAWLEGIAPSLSPTAQDEQVALATAWTTLGLRTKNGDCYSRAMKLLKPITAADTAKAEAFYVYALAAYHRSRLGDGPSSAGLEPQELRRQAEQAYRHCLAKAADHWQALNNLAMLLAERTESLAEAAALAARAVELQPANPSVRDTLAYVQVQLKKFDDAVASLEKAVELDPSNPEWRVNLAWALYEKGDRDRLNGVLEQLEGSGDRAKRLSEGARRKLQQIRQGLRSARASAQ